MRIVTGKNRRVVLDTNVLVSAVLFGGIPQKILKMVIDGDIVAVTSDTLIGEFFDVLSKKFHPEPLLLHRMEEHFSKTFMVVRPTISVHELRDDDDNRVLEAASEGRCEIIITGDKELLELKTFQNIEIITPAQFAHDSLV